MRKVGLALVCTMAIVSSAAEASGRLVPGYRVPTPSTVSDKLRVAIEGYPQPDAPLAAVPSTIEAWRRHANPDPKKALEQLKPLLNRYKLTLSSIAIAGVPCFVVSPSDEAARPQKLLMHIHGGAYTAGGGPGGVTEAVYVAAATRMRTISVDYRMPPDHPFPEPMNDVAAVWEELSSQHPESKLGLFGTSTGGAMVLSLTQRLIREKRRVPDAIMAGTPWSDLSETGDSYFTNRFLDPMPYAGILSKSAELYANGRSLTDPQLSPVYGSFERFPPTLLISGTRDLFLSNTIRVDRKLRDAKRDTQLIVYEAQSHAAYFSGPDFPETQTFQADVSQFFEEKFRE